MDTKSSTWDYLAPNMTESKIVYRTLKLDTRVCSWLRTNAIKNRHLSARKIKLYKEIMESGNWVNTSNSMITISNDGNLIDGAHRIMAFLNIDKKLDHDIYVQVGFNEPESNFKYFDQGLLRNQAHIFEIMGVKNAMSISSLVRKVFAFYSTDKNRVTTLKHSVGIPITTVYDFYEFIKEDIEDYLNHTKPFRYKYTFGSGAAPVLFLAFKSKHPDFNRFRDCIEKRELNSWFTLALKKIESGDLGGARNKSYLVLYLWQNFKRDTNPYIPNNITTAHINVEQVEKDFPVDGVLFGFKETNKDFQPQLNEETKYESNIEMFR